MDQSGAAIAQCHPGPQAGLDFYTIFNILRNDNRRIMFVFGFYSHAYLCVMVVPENYTRAGEAFLRLDLFFEYVSRLLFCRYMISLVSAIRRS